jgi:DNA-binding NarL/FixJ family response regulator
MKRLDQSEGTSRELRYCETTDVMRALVATVITEVAMRPLKLLIADDQEIVRVGVRNLLEGHPGWSVVAEAADGREAVEKAKAAKPDVVVLDIGLPNLNGLEAARQIIKNSPATKVLFLTMNEADALIQQALETGVRGFVLKTDPAADLVAALHALRNNQTFFTPKVEQILLDGFLKKRSVPASSTPRLTARQCQIAKLLAEGKTTKEVASLLNMSIKTAETHRANLMYRLHCHSVVDLVRYCIRNEIIDLQTAQEPRSTHNEGVPVSWSFDEKTRSRTDGQHAMSAPRIHAHNSGSRG